MLDSVKNLFDSSDDYWQWLILGAAIIFSLFIKKAITVLFDKTETRIEVVLKQTFHSYKGFKIYPFILAGTLGLMVLILEDKGRPCSYIFTGVNLVLAYCVYNVVTVFSRGHFIPKVVGGVMYLYLALSLLGWLKPVRDAMMTMKIPSGSMNLNVWNVVSALVVLLLLLWVVGVINSLVDNSTRRNKEIPPTMRVLITKASRLLLYLSAVLMSLKIAGVDLRALAFFSGAFGLGLGFGLQKVISNLVSGVIILLDKSIKPGDVIEIDGTYGWINTLRTRYVSVLTRDRKEILIPNEDFVTNKVVNWSFSDTNVRIRADVGIAYGSDVEQAIKCCEEAASQVTRVLGDPNPRCLLVGFGDSSVDLQIRFWINDASEGVANVRSEVLLGVWRLFKEHNIQIPFPQREILIKNLESDTLDSMKK